LILGKIKKGNVIMLFKTLRNLFLLSVLSISCLAQEPVIDGPEKASVNTPVWLKLNLPEGATGKFDNHFVDINPEHVVSGAALFIATAAGDYRIVAVYIIEKEITFVEKTISVSGGPVAPNDESISKTNIEKWLAKVPKDCCNEEIEHPITGEKITRQKAIGQTFLNIGKAADAIGSIAGLELMLSTALTTVLGDDTAAWQEFADKIDNGLLLIKNDPKSTVQEYAALYILIGETLNGETK